MQAITMPDQRYDAYRYGCDWIQKYIFPGGLCPSLSALISASSARSQLVLERADNIADSYAKTLSCWRHAFNRNWSEIEKLGFDDRFRRMWNYYLAYCEAGFAERAVGTHQLVFARGGAGSCVEDYRAA